MSEYTYVGIDDHEKSIAVKRAKGKENPEGRIFPTTEEGRDRFRSWVEDWEPGNKIIAACEAGPKGPCFARMLQSWGWQCFVLAPHALDRSPKHRQQKSDLKDAERALDALRGHYLAGKKLHACWLPDEELFDHRELVRGRLDLGEKIGKVKNQILTLCRRHEIQQPAHMKTAWTKKHIAWLAEYSSRDESATASQLASLVRQLCFLQEEEIQIDQLIQELSGHTRYTQAVRSLTRMRGVGVLSAMVYTLEIGKADRFKNRRQVGAYFGLVPSQKDSGETERKGRITRAGQPRVRKILNQVAWSIVRYKPLGIYNWYYQVKQRRGSKKAIVALMRRLAVIMWHRVLEAQAA